MPLRLSHAGPLDAPQLLELYLPLDGADGITIVHDGEVTEAARKWASRLGIELARVDPPSAAVPGAPDAPPVRAVPSVPAVPTERTVPAVLEVREDPPAPPAEPGILPDPEPFRLDTPFIVAPSSPEPELDRAILTEPALPWDLSLSGAEPSPAHVEIGELLAFPWNTLDAIAQRAAEEDDGHEILGGSPRRVPTLEHPTSLLPKGPNWGLPWPRPVGPNDAMAKADPALWRAPERLAAMREDLDKIGAPSFGAAKPDGSAWLKKLSDAG